MAWGQFPAQRSLRFCYEPLPRHVQIRQPVADLEPVRIFR